MRSLVEKRSWLGRRYDFSSTDRDQPRPLFYLTRVGRDRTGFEKRSVILWGFFGHANDRPGNAVGHRPAPSDWTGPTSRKRRDRVPADWVPRVRPHRFFFPPNRLDLEAEWSRRKTIAFGNANYRHLHTTRDSPFSFVKFFFWYGPIRKRAGEYQRNGSLLSNSKKKRKK